MLPKGFFQKDSSNNGNALTSTPLLRVCEQESHLQALLVFAHIVSEDEVGEDVSEDEDEVKYFCRSLRLCCRFNYFHCVDPAAFEPFVPLFDADVCWYLAGVELWVASVLPGLLPQPAMTLLTMILCLSELQHSLWLLFFRLCSRYFWRRHCRLHSWDSGVLSFLPFIAVCSCFKQTARRKLYSQNRSVRMCPMGGPSVDFKQETKLRCRIPISTLTGRYRDYIQKYPFQKLYMDGLELPLNIATPQKLQNIGNSIF